MRLTQLVGDHLQPEGETVTPKYNAGSLSGLVRVFELIRMMMFERLSLGRLSSSNLK
jgi:hypothetical protein